ncbi:MAG TPA: endolytic transglycosylase MltG [Bryobacteraceae bacterium]|nr:endolytic transglycosylase MltG [Bryobacteraceae bacterium]
MKLRLLLAAFLVALLLAACGAWLILAPYQGFSKEQFVEIQKGTGSSAIGRQLQAAGVIRASTAFVLVRLLRPDARLEAGEYRFDHPDSAWDVFDRLVRGDIFYYQLTIPEGSNMFDVASAIDRLGFIKGDDFVRVAHDARPIRDLDPRAPTLEGYLFPSTYRVTRHATAASIAHMMMAEFRRQWRQLEPPPGTDVHEIVTMAAMVEKETAVPGERPEVASVYYNRLRDGMALDCDPTTIYAALLENRYRGTIYRSDLQNASPYNTYAHAGLPPGPIANPGVASLRAALHPAQTNYLYFVRKPDSSGSHTFSATLVQHEAAVQAYRRGMRVR